MWFILLALTAAIMFTIEIVFVGITGPLMSSGQLAGAIVLSFLPFVALCLLISLLVVHFYLRVIKNWTTQEYIDHQREERGKQELAQEAARVETNRAETDAKAEEVRQEWLRQRELEKKREEEKKARRTQREEVELV